MDRQNLIYRIFDLYYDGFRHMRLGKTLWLVIIVKLFVIFFVLRLFFFPDFLKTHAADGDKADFVSKEITQRMEQAEHGRE